ncbi:Toxin RelE [termite gut metagenome]|uniref:Toxin RelE n=1 Tax=termite gut metagenome TaxID=433724 RepID=A0A5J4RI35_9ZZZZ
MYNVVIEKKVAKILDRLPNEYYLLIMRHLLELEQNPRPFGYIKLSGFVNLYRIRVGVYRIIYTIEDEILTVEVIKIDHRNSAYK